MFVLSCLELMKYVRLLEDVYVIELASAVFRSIKAPWQSIFVFDKCCRCRFSLIHMLRLGCSGLRFSLRYENCVFFLSLQLNRKAFGCIRGLVRPPRSLADLKQTSFLYYLPYSQKLGRIHTLFVKGVVIIESHLSIP